LDEDVKMFVSHPFAVTPSQFKYPVLQLEIVHNPPEHPDIALGKLHTKPQPPQFKGDVFRFISHPFDVNPSQFEYPALQKEITHDPPEHPDMALGKLHTKPQPPQFKGDVFRFISHPSVTLLLQSLKPGSQKEMTQTPPEHAETALAKLHTIPHEPQFVTDVLMFVSHPSDIIPLQSTNPFAQLIIFTLSEVDPHKFVIVHDKI